MNFTTWLRPGRYRVFLQQLVPNGRDSDGNVALNVLEKLFACRFAKERMSVRVCSNWAVKSAQLDLPHPSGWSILSMCNRLHWVSPFRASCWASADTGESTCKVMRVKQELKFHAGFSGEQQRRCRNTCHLSVLAVCVCSGDGGVTVSCFATFLLLPSEAVLLPQASGWAALCWSDFGPGFSWGSAAAPQAEVAVTRGLKPAQVPAPLLAQVCCKG